MSQMGRFLADIDLTVTGNVGGAIAPDVVGDLGLTGSGAVTVTGTPGTHSLDITVTGVVPIQFDTDVGSAVPALGILDILGGTNLNSAGAGSAVTVNLDDAITLTTVNATTLNATSVNTTNIAASALGRGIVQSSATGVLSSSEGTNGQFLVSSDTGGPIFANLDSSSGRLDVTNGPNTIDVDTFAVLQSDTGFATWTGAGNYYDDTVLGDFEILRGGTGFIKGVPVTWIGAQNITGLTSGNAYYIYVDDTGTIGKTSTRTDSLYSDYIVLFQCWRDAKLPTNNQKTVKENHPYDFPVHTSNYLHNSVGSIIENVQKGANITLNGTQKIEISGADELDDHGLETYIPDSGGIAEIFANLYTDAAGKWVVHTATDTFAGEYNNAGTVTALGASKYGVYTLYVGKDDLNTVTPRYGAVLDTSQYNNLSSAQTAIANGAVAVSTNELSVMENCRLGYIIFSESSTSIVDVIIDKNTLRSTNTTSGTNQASLVSTDVTNFNGILSAADTNVQSALETLDDYTVDLTADVTGILPIANGGTNTNAMTTTYGVNYFDGTKLVTTTVGTSTHVLTSNGVGVAPTFQAGASGTVTSVSGGTNITDSGTATDPILDLDATITLTTVNATTFDTNVAAAAVTLAGTSLIADGTDANINVNITAKGTGQVIIDDLQLTTDLTVPYGGTGASTFTDHGVLLGSGAGAITALGEASNGQLVVGSTGNDPSLATLTAGTGISVTNAAGSITVANAGTTLKNETGTTYSLILTDAQKHLTFTNAAAVTVTVPTNAAISFEIGTIISFSQNGAGQVSFQGAAPPTLRSADSALTTVKQYSVGCMVKIATDEWIFGGDLEA